MWLHTSLFNCMLANGYAYILEHSETLCMHSLTLWNILHALLNILEHSATFCMHSTTFCMHSACILQHCACILEHSVTFYMHSGIGSEQYHFFSISSKHDYNIVKSLIDIVIAISWNPRSVFSWQFSQKDSIIDNFLIDHLSSFSVLFLIT